MKLKQSNDMTHLFKES